jgi:hypothetical protein
MTDALLSAADGGPDDLPRSFRRERDAQREARDRAHRERDMREHDAAAAEPGYGPDPALASYAPDAHGYGYDPASGVVTRIDVPFVRLTAFFIKAVFAAIPALIILTVMLWGMGQALTNYAPWLLKMKILITFPN